MEIRTTFYCNVCLKECSYIDGGSYYNSYKQLTLCKKCLEKNISINPKLGDGYVHYQPERSKREDDDDDCLCNCHD